MAVTSSLGNLFKLTKTTQSSKKGLETAGKSLQNISQIVGKRTKIKRDIFDQTRMLRNRRVESERRSQLEDEIESVDNLKKPDGAKNLAQADTSKGFFGRLIGFVGYLTAGWLLNNLPTLLGMGKEFIARMKKAGELLSGFLSNTIKIFTNFGNVLGSLGQNIASFDFLDDSNRLKSSLDQLNSTVAGLGEQMEEAFGLITTPLTQGKYSGKDIPAPGTQQQSEGAYETQSPSGGAAGGGQWKPLLDLIASKESAGGNYEAMYPSTTLPGATQMTISEVASRATGAVGRYQQLPEYIVGRAKSAGLNPDKDLYSPVNQDLIASKVNIGMNRGGNAWLAGKIPTEQFMQGLSQEFAALPNAYGKFNYPGQGSSIKPEQVKGALDKVKRGSEVPSGQSQQIEQVPAGNVKPVITSRYGDQRRNRRHGGTDLAVNSGTPLRAVADGKIIETGFDKEGWGYFLVYQDTSGLFHLYGHMPSGSYKTGGAVRKGEVIGKVGTTGNTSGPHLHWEVGKSWNGTIGGKFDPLQIYSPNAPFNTPPGPGVAPGVPAQISAPPQQQRASYPAGITPERRGQDIIIAQQPYQQTVVMGGGGGSSSPGPPPVSNSMLLNNFIKNKLLLDLAYL